MNKLHQEVKRISGTMIFIATILSASQVLAEPATLNGVEISASNSRGYDIVLNTDNAPEIATKSATSDKLVLDLKNTKVTKDTNTVYKNADGIEHIILKPEANNVQIEINGKSAGSSNVAVNNSIASLPADYNNTVFINRPLNSYAPIHEPQEEITTASSLSVAGILKAIYNSPTLREILSSSNLGWIVSFVMMFGFLIWTNRKNSRRSEVSVKINPAKEDTENKLLKDALQRKEGLLGAEGVGTTRKTQIRPKTQEPAVSAQKANYGLKAYGGQSATVRPSASTTSFKPQNIPTQQDLARLQQAVAARKPMRTSTAARTSTATAQEIKESTKKNEVHIDNVKFLESMAKIYERSGRVDLANGLANNIKKAKTTK